MESVSPTELANHRAIRVWQERKGEISWLCSCGTANKHVPMLPGVNPVELLCVSVNEKVVRERVLRNVKAE